MAKKALIIGGGPAGLTAAYELATRTNIQPLVVEQSSFWGGISRTEEQNGNRIDIGGHRFFSKSDEVMQWWQNILPIQSDQEELQITYQNKTKKINVTTPQYEFNDNVLLVRKRKSRIYSNKKFFSYPITLSLDTIAKLGYINTFLIGLSYVKSTLLFKKELKTLEDFFIKRFGKRLYLTFFKDYTEKVWGVPCKEISAQWGEQRIKGLSITKTLVNATKQLFKNKTSDLSQKNTETSLIEYFLYPKYGPGQMWECVAKEVEKNGGILIQNQTIKQLYFEGNKITKAVAQDIKGNKTSFSLDYCFSTMPVKHLINAFQKTIPESIKSLSQGLLYRDFITVGLLIDNIEHDLEDNWIYIQENYVKVGRLQIFNNWSPYMVKDPSKTWVGLEYFCNTTDALWKMSDSGLKKLAIKEMIELGFINNTEQVSDTKVIKVPKAYPAYFGSDNQFDKIQDYLIQIDNLYCIGRNGMHKYNNQDHSMLTAIRSVDAIVNNHPNKSSIWNINTEMEYHEEK